MLIGTIVAQSLAVIFIVNFAVWINWLLFFVPTFGGLFIPSSLRECLRLFGI